MLTSVLKNKNFRNFFLADIISGFGSGMTLIGANWFLLKLTGENRFVALLMCITVSSALLVFPFAGTIADRFHRRQVMMLANFVRAAFLLIVALLLWSHGARPALLFLLAAVSGAGWSIFLPASRGFVQEILPRKDYLHGSSLVEISLQVGMFAAAAVCGVIYKYFGFGTILLIDAATFLVSNAFLSLIAYVPTSSLDRHEAFFSQFLMGGNISGGIN